MSVIALSETRWACILILSRRSRHNLFSKQIPMGDRDLSNDIHEYARMHATVRVLRKELTRQKSALKGLEGTIVPFLESKDVSVVNVNDLNIRIYRYKKRLMIYYTRM